MAIDKESIKKIFPHLYKELEEGECKIPINGVRKNGEEYETEEDEHQYQEPCECERVAMPDKLRHFDPSVVDFIRRCDTDLQAGEIIDYLEKKGEITKDVADRLRCKLKCEGVRGFGSKKEENYYFKEGGFY